MVRYAGAWVDIARERERLWQTRRIAEWLKTYDSEKNYNIASDNEFPVYSRLRSDPTKKYEA